MGETGSRSPSAQDPTSRGVRWLRLHHEGVLQYLERRADVRFIVEPATGQLLLPVEPGMARAGEEMLLWAPSEDAWDVQIALLARVVDRPESVEGVDRWQAYHAGSGSAALMTWVRGEVEGIKARDQVFGADECVSINTLGRAEYALIKSINSDREALARGIKRSLGVAGSSDMLCVGVDPHGIDVRARFGILRVEFAEGLTVKGVEQAEREIARLLAP